MEGTIEDEVVYGRVALAATILFLAGLATVVIVINHYAPDAHISANEAFDTCRNYLTANAHLQNAVAQAAHDGWVPTGGLSPNGYAAFRPDVPLGTEINLGKCDIRAMDAWVRTFGQQVTDALLSMVSEFL